MNIIKKLVFIRKLKYHYYKWDENKIHANQEKRLKKLLKFIKNHSPYYSQALPDSINIDFSKIPIIDKTEMMKNFDQLNTKGIKKDEATKFRILQEKNGAIDLFKDEYTVGSSSGTSGNRSIAVLSKNERELYGCLMWARNGVPDNIKKKRVLFTFRRNNSQYMEVEKFGVKIVHMDYTHEPEEYIRAINEKKLNIIAGPPSLLKIIAEHKESIHHPIEAIISYAEVLCSNLKKDLEKIFQVPISQIYHGSEGFYASTCNLGKLHLHEDTIYFELEDTEDFIGNAKNIIVTDLYRRTQPIVRYRLNDIIELSSVKCPCGSNFRVIERIHGRMDDVFHIEGIDGKIKMLFPDYVRRSINQASDEILEYQALQHSINLIEIRLLLTDKANREEIEQQIINNLEFWISKINGKLCEVQFTNDEPEIHSIAKKMIRINRKF